MKKTFITPSLEVKKFNRGNIITLSGEVTETNVDMAIEKAVDTYGVSVKDVIKVSL
ncbi:MAG: hypothetical protein Q4G33_05865 [bacterium]|nr:hypothetical protein [bacterium]